MMDCHHQLWAQINLFSLKSLLWLFCQGNGKINKDGRHRVRITEGEPRRISHCSPRNMTLTHLTKCSQRSAGTPRLSQHPLSVSQHQHKHKVSMMYVYTITQVYSLAVNPQRDMNNRLYLMALQGNLSPMMLRVTWEYWFGSCSSTECGWRQQTANKAPCYSCYSERSWNPGSSQGNSPIKNLALSPSSQPRFLFSQFSYSNVHIRKPRRTSPSVQGFLLNQDSSKVGTRSTFLDFFFSLRGQCVQ